MFMIENPKRIKPKENARIVQLVFIKVKGVKRGYNGIYQNKR